MARPRLLLVPNLCEIEWRIRPLLEEWADVASFDAPGVGDEPASESLDADAIVERGLTEVDKLGWERFVVVGDEFGVYQAVKLAARRREAVRALVLGHACLSLRETGERPPINTEVWGALEQLRDVDYRSYARHLTQVTRDAYDDELADLYVAEVSQEVNRSYETAFAQRAEEPLQPLIEELGVPLLFVKHEGCLVFTDEGWEDAVAAFPPAQTLQLGEKPSTSAEFAQALRGFCEALPE